MIFLRPWWLCALLIPLLFFSFKKTRQGKNPWQKIIDKKLLNALTIQKKIPIVPQTLSKLIFVLWSLCCIALSGPAWDKIPVPSVQMKTNTVLVLDLNQSLTPSQIQQIHIKLYDILTLLKEDRVGLVLFGQNQGYTAMPLTPDIQLIQNLIPSLLPSVLPENALNLKAGIQEAEKILTQTGSQGRILVISNQPLPQSKFPIFTFNPQKDSLTQLAGTLQSKGTFNSAPLQGNDTTDIWYDRGIWLALLALIPACLLFRKNVIFLWLIWGFVLPSEAGWFQRDDQEKYTLNQKGIQTYRDKDYPLAEDYFKQANHPYNLGNALAYQGKIQEAIAAYQEALKRNPEDEDAQFNKEYLEKQLPKNEAQSNQDQKQNTQQQKPQSEPENQPQTQENNQPQEQDANDSKEEKQESQQPDSDQPPQEEAPNPIEQIQPQEQTEEPFNQEEQQILNRLNHDPARVLRYRINLQHQKRFMP